MLGFKDGKSQEHAKTFKSFRISIFDSSRFNYYHENKKIKNTSTRIFFKLSIKC